MPYIPHTPRDQERMMRAIGIGAVDELFRDVPESLRLRKQLDLPEPLSEMELVAELNEIANANRGVDHYTSFLGAGAYDHFVPSAVNHLVSRSEFYTAYTPYQAEISQGILQAIYEFQTMVCILTGMDVANASMYDGATAAAEAAVMSLNASGRKRVLVSQFVNPEYRSVISTYLSGGLATVDELACPGGVTGIDQLRAMLDDSVASVIVQYPNFAGIVEDLEALAGECQRVGAALIVIADPISLGLLKSPGALGADIVVGEGQSMGNPLHFGGPYLGFMGARVKYLRYLPGRISGATTDGEGNRGFVLTLQAREQHIRRERAYSNICTNQSLNALAATIYLSLMGKTGLRRVAELCLNKSHYLAGRLCEIDGVSMAYEAPFFKEFVVRLPMPAEEVVNKLRTHRILAGVPMGRYYSGMENLLLICVTEKRTKEDMDEFVQRLGAIL
ncbi:MAG: aminomethyl-transferring glycine dehydrogenase subunit GcvPA [Firmicutes bacterium]|nr:aminomethyl-transferring glycine dehydrogenase subunit GcvPA [Bacillota bacterium]